MANKLTYEELEKRVKELEKELHKHRLNQEALRESEERYRALFDRSLDCVYVHDFEGNFLDANPAALEVFGYTREEIGSLNFGSLLTEDQMPTALLALEELKERGCQTGLTDYRLKDKHGKDIYVETKASVIYRGKKAYAVQGVARDISLRKQAEDALRQAQNELERQVEERTTELKKANEELKKGIAKLEQVEESLRESEEKYKFLAENMADIVWTTDMGFRNKYVSPSVEKMLGFTAEERKRQSLEEMVTPQSVQKINQALLEEIEREKREIVDLDRSLTIDIEYYKKDGSTVWLENCVKAIRDADNQMVGILGVSRDITQRKQAEADLRESEERFRAIFEQAAVGVGLVETETGRFLGVNRKYCDIVGHTREEMTGMTFMEITHPDDLQASLDKIERLRRGEVRDFTFEKRYVQKDGSIIWVNLTVSPMWGVDEKPNFHIAVVQNITDRKDTEEALRDSEEKYRLLVENANDAIFVAQDGVVKFPNSRTLNTVGYSEDELAKTPFSEFLHPEDRDMVVERYIKRLKGEAFPSTYPFRVFNKSGEELWVELNAVLISWEGRPATLNFLRDITEKRHLEAQLRQAQKMEYMGTLAGGIAHDFNNLLMAIQGNVSLMLLRKDPADPDYGRLKNIEEYIQSGAELTGQLLGFARGGRYAVRPSDLNELLKKISDMFGRTRKEVSIYPKYQEGIWSVEVDRGQMEQVLMNLYINAWQAMPGGGELFLETENVELSRGFVRPYGVRPGRYVKVAVTDTGVGMDEKTLERIFDPFFTTKEMGRGTGLGLASVYGIIKNHGGIINVRSKKGEGATFMIYLPASEGEVIKDEEPRDEVLRGEETILLVDDEEMIIGAGKEILEEMGYRVITATSGQEAIDVFKKRKHEIDMVILDMVMPGVGGGKAYDRLKGLDPDVRVLLSSGYSMDGEAAEILKRGCNGFIQKPFDMKEISNKIREILDQR